MILLENLKDFMKRNYRIFVILVILILLGLYSKIYTGPFHFWANNHLGGFLYVIFFIILFHLFKPDKSHTIIALSILAMTILIEFSQLLRPKYLIQLRQNFFIRSLIGTTFSWMDFPYYIFGAAFGFLILRLLNKSER